tara:strand:+ start:848 stop:1030 length:183 start_codon:yes stop_codon:yes gene_type:complete
MTRQERIALHKKQERIQVRNGVPVLVEMKEGIPEIRRTTEGVVEYVKSNGVLYKKALDKA